MNKQESKYFNTAHFFDEALINLLDKKQYEYISVKEICEEAGYNRSTFYLHYETINDLLKETLEYINNKFNENFGNSNNFALEINNKNKESLIFINDEYLRPYLTFIKENKKIFSLSFSHPEIVDSFNKYSYLKKYILNPVLDKYNVSQNKRKFIIEFYVQGTMGIIREWTKDDCKDDIDDIIKIIIECVRPWEK